MKALFTIALAALTLSQVPAQARSLIQLRPVLELATDDAKEFQSGNRPVRPMPMRNFSSMTLTVRNDQMLVIKSQRYGQAEVKLSQETYNEIFNSAAIISEAKVLETRQDMICMAIPTDYRDSLKVSRGLSLERGPYAVPGTLRLVSLQGGCYYSQHLGLEQEYQRAAVASIIATIRVLAIEALNQEQH